MNNINTLNKDNHKRHNTWKNLGYALILTGLLNVNSPTYAQTNISRNNSIEQIDSNIKGINIPTIYQGKLDDFLANHNVMNNNDAKKFTMEFISKEMEADRGINKENQLLFIRHSIYKQVTNQDLYDGKDGDQKILDDFNNKIVNLRLRACGQKYKNGIVAYMNEVAAEADRMSAEADRMSAEADRMSAEADKGIMQKDTLGLKEMAEFYSLYIKNPNNVKKEEIEKSKELLKRVIPDCKKYGIDYKAILLKEVGDKKKVDAILKFYGVE